MNEKNPLHLIPTREAQPINLKIRDHYYTYKGESIDGKMYPFGTDQERMALMLVYNIGLENLLKLLPQESKETLRELLKEHT